MTGDAKTSDSNGGSSRRSALRRKLGGEVWSINIIAGFLIAVMQYYIWGFLFFMDTRPTAVAMGALAGTFALAVQATFTAASMARRRDSSNQLVLFAVGYAFLLITGEFAALYWTFGTGGNFNVEPSRVDAIYFALGTLTTGGTGDIVPRSDLAKAFVCGQMILDLAYIAGTLTIAVTRWSESRAQ
jgi:Ion channel